MVFQHEIHHIKELKMPFHEAFNDMTTKKKRTDQLWYETNAKMKT